MSCIRLRCYNYYFLMRILHKIPMLILSASLFLEALSGSTVRVINRVDNSTDEIKTLDNLRGVYVSAKDVSRVLSSRQPYVNSDRNKMVIYIGNNRLKISGNSSFVLVDELVYQMPNFAVWNNGDIYVQAEALFNLIKETTMPGIGYDPKRMVLDIDIKEFNITGVDINEKANGTILRIKTRSNFPEGNISSFFHENGWFYITIADALVDTTEIRRSDIRGVVRSVTADQLENTAQIAFQIKSKVDSHELYQGKDPSEIVVSLRTPMDNSIARIKEVKDRWKLDTVVLDAGHGSAGASLRSSRGLPRRLRGCRAPDLGGAVGSTSAGPGRDVAGHGRLGHDGDRRGGQPALHVRGQAPGAGRDDHGLFDLPRRRRPRATRRVFGSAALLRAVRGLRRRRCERALPGRALGAHPPALGPSATPAAGRRGAGPTGIAAQRLTASAFSIAAFCLPRISSSSASLAL